MDHIDQTDSNELPQASQMEMGSDVPEPVSNDQTDQTNRNELPQASQMEMGSNVSEPVSNDQTDQTNRNELPEGSQMEMESDIQEPVSFEREDNEDNIIDLLKRIFFYKSQNECFTLANDGSLKITHCEIQQLNMVNPVLVRYGNFARKSEMKDLRNMDIQDVITHMQSFKLGQFCCFEILSNPSTLFFDLPNMKVSANYISFFQKKCVSAVCGAPMLCCS